MVVLGRGDQTCSSRIANRGLPRPPLPSMGECGVVSTPDNFELFYAYASGENPAVTQLMSCPDHRQTAFHARALLQDLRLRCLSGARAAQAIERAGQQHECDDR